MSGTTSTLSGATVVSQFTPPATGAALAALSSFTGSFSVDSVNGVYSVPGAVFLEPGVTSATITSATIVVSNSPNANITVTTLPSAEIFAAPGDTVSATGADTLFGASSLSGYGANSFISTGDNSSIVGGTGDLNATASGANTTLIGGTGTNNFTVSGSNSLAVAGYSGHTTITLTDPDADSVPGSGVQITTNPLPGTTGILTATLSPNGADTVIGGGGTSMITAGQGADVFGFVNGHAGGVESITGFNAKDNFAFGGYDSLGGAIASEAVNTTIDPAAGGSDVITLTDGTVITLVGYDNKVF
jgi:hypothetical protein